MKQVFKKEDGKFLFHDSIVVERGQAIPEGYEEITEEMNGKYKDNGEVLTDEELEEIRNTPIPKSEVELLQEENITLMLALTDLYEEKELQNAQREQENIDTMLAITELYELMMEGK